MFFREPPSSKSAVKEPTAPVSRNASAKRAHIQIQIAPAPAPGSVLAERPFSGMELLGRMVTIREADRREGNLIRQGKGWIHIPGMGHEALAAITYHLRAEDYLFTYYRDRALMVGRGLTPEQLALDYFACAKSSTGGRGMPVHCSARHLNIFPPATPTGSQCLPAVGAAWGMKLASAPHVVICTIGDAAVRQGEFYEALCLAVQEKLPVIFVVEDNAYGISTPTEGQLPLRIGIFQRELFVQVNGRDALEVLDKSGEAIRRARQGEGPTILWCELDRLKSHTNSDDHRLYRAASEITDMRGRDPLAVAANQLFEAGELTVEGWSLMQEQATRAMDELYQKAEREAQPDGAAVLTHLYAPPVSHSPVPFQPEEPTTTMAAAINRVLRAGLNNCSRMVMFGEDIEDPKGGVFGFTKGLSQQFPRRVVNAPLAEATIVGTAVGLAATGYRPVFEMQFIDFITPAFNQLVQQAATLRWRSNGEWGCPMVIYSPYGAYLPAGGTWHSQSNEGWWTHIPGIRVAVPSTPADAVGLFWSAFQDGDPSLILIPKHLMRVRMPVQHYETIRWGAATARREGGDVTIVSWGNCLELADQAAAQLAPEGISVEVLDLRSLVPCDWETIERSLGKTGRLVVITEDNVTCSFGQSVVARVVSEPNRFRPLVAPPQLVARPDVHVPYHPRLEAAVLPSLTTVLDAVYATLQ
jgi:2-oxoisovalerate dehydrogenase E1 component